MEHLACLRTSLLPLRDLGTAGYPLRTPFRFQPFQVNPRFPVYSASTHLTFFASPLRGSGPSVTDHLYVVFGSAWASPWGLSLYRASAVIILLDAEVDAEQPQDPENENDGQEEAQPPVEVSHVTSLNRRRHYIAEGRAGFGPAQTRATTWRSTVKLPTRLFAYGWRKSNPRPLRS